MNAPPIPPRRSSTSEDKSIWWIVYDADCGFCSRIVAWMTRQRALVEFHWLPMASIEAKRLVPDRPPDEMAVVGPTGVWFGGDAAIVSLWTLARYRWLSKLLALPGIRSLVRWSYRIVARRRYWISRLLGDTCQIPQKP